MTKKTGCNFSKKKIIETRQLAQGAATIVRVIMKER